MKIIDRYILSIYIKTFLSALSICFIIFIIQAFWTFFDELAGKGLNIGIILKFLLYLCPSLYTMVMPLAVLLTSLIVCGNLSENNEFFAMKSSGISLTRCLRSLVFFHLALGIMSFFFANYAMPYAETKQYNLRKNLSKLQPSLAIQEGIFNKIGKYIIKVGKKYGEEERFLSGVTIYETTPDNKNNIVIRAAKGELKSDLKSPILQLVLTNGSRYEEIITKNPKQQLKLPHTKAHFEQYVMNIDLSQFNQVDLSKESITKIFNMQRADQLNTSIDSLEKHLISQRNAFGNNFVRKNRIPLQTSPDLPLEDETIPNNVFDFMQEGKTWKKSQVMLMAVNSLRGASSNLSNRKHHYKRITRYLNLHRLYLNRKFTIIFSGLLLFTIGAPLGAIIRKGGLGLPLVLAVLIFLVYLYIGIFSENSVKNNSIPAYLGSWLPTILVTPFSIFLSYKAILDKQINNVDLNRIGATLGNIKKLLHQRFNRNK